MSKKIGVNKIVLTIGDKEIPLSVSEAKELKAALESLFPEPKTSTYPVFVDRYVPRPFYDYRPYTWGSSSGNISLCAQSTASPSPDFSKLLDYNNTLGK